MQTLFLSLLSGILLACSPSGDSEKDTNNNQTAGNKNKGASYTIQGEINRKDPDKGYIYLKSVKQQGRKTRTQKIDSTKPDSKGSFTFKGTTEEASFHRINLYGNTPYTIVLHPGTYSLTVHEKGREPAISVENSRPNEEFRILQTIKQEFQGKVQAIKRNYQNDQSRKGAQKKRFYQNKINKVLKERNKRLKDFIDTVETPIVAMNAASMLEPEKHLDYLDKLAKRFQKSHPDSKYTQQFKDYIDKQKKDMPLEKGETAPDFTLKTPEGKSVSLKDFRGQYVLVDFWAAWCGPCRKENPHLVKTYKKYQDENFEILGVSLDKQKQRWVKAIKQDGLIWPQVSDLKGWNSKVVPKYKIKGIPYNYLLDKEGKIIARNLRGNQLDKKLKELFRDK